MDTEQIPRRFDFTRDRFAFANELIWEYRTNPATGKMHFLPREPKSDYVHRCFVLVRVARQFLYHARFDPGQKVAGESTYEKLTREVLARSPRKPCVAENQIIFPGYANLFDFSMKNEKLLKSECGGAWQSYVLRSHWRMILPFSRAHQRQTSAQLIAAVQKNVAPIIHLVTFPSLTINHGMILFDAREARDGVEFLAYDPNDPTQPARLTFDAGTNTFSLPVNRYWAGGNLNVMEIYRGWLM